MRLSTSCRAPRNRRAWCSRDAQGPSQRTSCTLARPVRCCLRPSRWCKTGRCRMHPTSPARSIKAHRLAPPMAPRCALGLATSRRWVRAWPCRRSPARSTDQRCRTAGVRAKRLDRRWGRSSPRPLARSTGRSGGQAHSFLRPPVLRWGRQGCARRRHGKTRSWGRVPFTTFAARARPSARSHRQGSPRKATALRSPLTPRIPSSAQSLLTLK